MTNKAYPILAAAAGLLAGYFIGSLGDSQEQQGSSLSMSASSAEAGSGAADPNGAAGETSGLESKDSSLIGSSTQPGQGTLALDEEEATAKKRPRTPEQLRDALLAAKDDPNPISRSAAFAEVLAQLSDENLDEVVEAFDQLAFGFENAHDYRMLLYAWGQIDPLAAIEYSNRRAKGIGAGFAVAGVLEGWAGREPKAAVDWVNLPENAGMAKLYRFGLVKGWASQDMEGATAYVLSLDAGGNRPDLLRTITDERLRRDFASTSFWAENLSDDADKKGVFTRVAQQQSRESPGQVAEWLRGHASEDYAADALIRLGDNWGKRAPAEAAAYFDDLPTGRARREGMSEIVESWARDEPAEAAAWLNQKDPSPETDPAVAAYARVTSMEEGSEASAMEWAVSITDPELQSKTVTSVGRNWYRRDKDAAEAWLPASGLSEQQQDAIRTPPKQSWWQTLRPKKD